MRIPTLEPLRGTKAHVGELLDAAATAEELVEALTGLRLRRYDRDRRSRRDGPNVGAAG